MNCKLYRPHEQIVDSTNPVHQDVCKICEENPFLQNLTEEQFNQLSVMLEFAWNRGYKKGYIAALESQ